MEQQQQLFPLPLIWQKGVAPHDRGTFNKFCLDHSLFEPSEKQQHVTHTLLTGGRLYVPDDLRNEFSYAYADGILENERVCLNECASSPLAPLFFDWDWQCLPDVVVTKQDLLAVIRSAHYHLAKTFSATDTFIGIVLSRPEKDNKFGFHVHYPTVKVTKEEAEIACGGLIAFIEQMYGKTWSKSVHPWRDKVIDRQVCGRNLRAVGSFKCQKCPSCRAKPGSLCDQCDNGHIFSQARYYPILILDHLGRSNEKLLSQIEVVADREKIAKLYRLTSIWTGVQPHGLPAVPYNSTGGESAKKRKAREQIERATVFALAERDAVNDFDEDDQNVQVETGNWERCELPTRMYDYLKIHLIKKVFKFDRFPSKHVDAFEFTTSVQKKQWKNRVQRVGSVVIKTDYRFCINKNNNHGRSTQYLVVKRKPRMIVRKCFSRPLCSEYEREYYYNGILPLIDVVSYLFSNTPEEQKAAKESFEKNVETYREKLDMQNMTLSERIRYDMEWSKAMMQRRFPRDLPIHKMTAANIMMNSMYGRRLMGNYTWPKEIPKPDFL